MTKNKNGNNKDGLGIMGLMHLAKYHPILYWLTVQLTRHGQVRLAKKILDVK